MADTQNASKPDFRLGFPVGDLADGAMVTGRVDTEDAILIRHGEEFFAVGASCTHYHGPLADGLIVDDSVRCPWHHACFDLRTGEALRAPALSPVDCWKSEQRDGRIFVNEKRAPTAPRPEIPADAPRRIVIVGGGAAGFAAAEMLRRRGFGGALIMLSSDAAPPVDRPNLSKDYLAGTAPEDWLPLRPDAFYAANRIELRLNVEVAGLDTKARELIVAGSESVPYDRLLLATGA